MQHFTLGVDVAPLSRSPYMPENTDATLLDASVLGLSPRGKVYFLPLIAGFVGADCVAATLATGIHKTEELSFLMDIGTNTEIVIGKKGYLAACSCASGPAFEGAHISQGRRAAPGAIESVWINPDTYEPNIKTIEDRLPLGLCGSGLIDLLSEMLKAGIMDSSGRLLKSENKRVRENSSTLEYVVAWRDETGIDSEISITQLDIRELQKGKAAMFSGAKTLMKSLNVSADQIKDVYMAGAFGSYINRESALNIGMLPEFELTDIHQVGNAAGTGASMALLSRKAREEAESIHKEVRYLELATEKSYNQEYLDALMFPHKDLSLFPSTVKNLRDANWVESKFHLK